MASEAQQTQLKLTLNCGGNGVAETARSEACSLAAANPENSSVTEHLMEQVVAIDNLRKAYVRVVSNKGAAGIDGMTVEDLHAWCGDNIGELRESLLNNSYQPPPDACDDWLLKRLDGWIRRKLRTVKLKQLKRRYTIWKFYIGRGTDKRHAWFDALSGKGLWRLSAAPQSHRSMSVQWFREFGLVSVAERWKVLQDRP